MPRIILALILMIAGMTHAETKIGPTENFEPILNERGETDIQVQTRMANAAEDTKFWSIITGVGALFVSAVALGFGITQSIVSHKKSQQELRARLNVSIRQDEIKIDQLDSERFLIWVNPIIKNDGATAAESIFFGPMLSVLTGWNNETEIGSMVEEDIELLRAPGYGPIQHFWDTKNHPYSLGAGEVRADLRFMEHAFYYNKFKDPMPKPPEKQPPSNLYFAGFIKYRDVFNKIWVRRFEWELFLNETVTEAIGVTERKSVEKREKRWFRIA